MVRLIDAGMRDMVGSMLCRLAQPIAPSCSMALGKVLGREKHVQKASNIKLWLQSTPMAFKYANMLL